MITKTIEMSSRDFFHARPSARIAGEAKTFESVIMIALGTSIADVKDPVSLMKLGHPKGSPLDLMADGFDEQAALDAVLKTMQEEFTLL